MNIIVILNWVLIAASSQTVNKEMSTKFAKNYN